jgi:flagellar biosynthesis anti-sigma factor FlgM
MRVDDRNLSGNQAAQSGKANQAQEVARPNASGTTASRAGAGADRVELSDLTGTLARAVGADAQARAGRVERLASEYAEGRYRVDSKAVSRALVAEMRASGGG